MCPTCRRERPHDGRRELGEDTLQPDPARRGGQLAAPKVNADIIRQEAKGQAPPFSVLLVHAMDLLLLAWSELDYTEQYIDTCKRLHTLESEVAEWRSRGSKSRPTSAGGGPPPPRTAAAP